jgi:predicted short-subunit dehydrogenase-like oxidoreductase (DUF2520 family)
MKRSLDVLVLGRGKLGIALQKHARAAGHRVRVAASRTWDPATPITADLLVLAVRDKELEPLAAALAAKGSVTARTVVVHVAGARSSAVLAALRGHAAGVAQMHPMIAFATPAFAPSLAGGHAHVEGDEVAVKLARRFCRSLGLVPRTFPGLDTVGYHAAAGLVANGAAALAALGQQLLVRAGARAEDVPHILGPLLHSVAENVAALGMPGGLTGPVRRGDAPGLARHLETIRKLLPEAASFYAEAARAQLPLARALGDATPEALDAVEALLRG